MLQGQKKIHNYCDITISSQCFLGRYLLLLDFGINGEVTEGLSAASRSMGIGNDVGGLFTQTLIHTLLGCPGKWQPGVGK